MADQFDIEINDRISSAIAEKLEKIAASALTADRSITQLQRSINTLNSSRLQGFQSSLNALNSSYSQLTRTQALLAAQTQALNAALNTLNGSQANLNRVTGAATSSWASFYRTLFVGGAILGVAGSIIKLADAYTNLQNKLQIASSSQEHNNELTNRAFELANKTRSGVLETAQAFARFDRALKGLGKSQEESLRLTETINKALIVSGATTRESAASLLQLSQAFNSGRLMGDEFRSVSENIPVVLDAISKVLGKPVNELKKLSSQGVITSKVLAEAFKLIENDIDAAFAKTTPTISQSFVVLNNSAIKFFGELNKATGTTAALSSAILGLANNLDIATVAAVTLGAALLFIGGPRVISGVIALGRVLLANPIGVFATAVAGAATYLALFKDEIDSGLPGLVTFGDLGSAAFEVIGNGAASLWANVKNDFSKLYNYLTSFWDTPTTKSSSFFDTQNEGWAGFLENAARVLDAIGGLITAFIDFGASRFKSFFEIRNVEDLKNYYRSTGKSWAESLEAGFQSQGGFLEKGIQDIFDKAKANALERKKNNILNAGSNLRGGGVSTFGEITNNNEQKAAETRAASLAKINAQFDNEISRFSILKPMREEQEKFDKIQESLLQKKIVLTDGESEAIRKKISQVEKLKEVERQGESYAKTVEDLRKYNLGLSEELQLLNLLPEARQTESEILRLKNRLTRDSINLSKEQLILIAQEEEAIRKKLQLLQEESLKSQLRDATIGERERFGSQLGAIQSLKKEGGAFTKGDASASAAGLLQQSGIDISGTNLQFEAEQAAYRDNKEKLKKIRAAQLIDERSYQQASLNLFLKKNERYIDSTQNFLGNLSVLQNSQSKKAFKIGQAAAVVNATIDTAKAAIGAYSSLASIPYVGPALGAAAATAAGIAGAYQIAQIKQQQPPSGYMLGGYTGNLPTNSVAGVVHGQEYVMTAEATRRIGVSTLEGMNRGKKASNDSGQSQVIVNVENHNGSKIEVEQIGPNEVRMIVKDEMQKNLAKDVPNIVAGELENSNSRVNKTLNSTYSMSRR